MRRRRRTTPATSSASTTAAARRCCSRTSPTPGPTRSRRSPPSRSSGDVDLADAKQRIGDRVCLFGGFNEHLLHEADADAVQDEVRRCLDAAMEGGGYVLRSTGQIFDAKPGLIEVMCETVRELRPLQLSGRSRPCSDHDLFEVETRRQGPPGPCR